jgi:hypothetical protein
MGSNREQQLVDKIRQLLPDSKKKYTWIDIEKVVFFSYLLSSSSNAFIELYLDR